MPTSPVSDEEIEFYMTSKSGEAVFETLAISHPYFSKDYFICRNAGIDGLYAKLEDGTMAFFEYYPLSIEASKQDRSLDYSLTISMGDLGSIFDKETDNLDKVDGAWDIFPTVVYRSYRELDVEKPLTGPMLLEMESYMYDDNGSSAFKASAERLNVSGTGEDYNFTQFPGLRGFLK